MGSLLGLAYLAGFGFAVWMWVEALCVPSERWPAVEWTKTRWFVVWYVSGLFTLGLAPFALAIYFYRSLRPTLRAGGATTPPGSQLSPPGHRQQRGPVTGEGVVPPWSQETPHGGPMPVTGDMLPRVGSQLLVATPPETVEESTPTGESPRAEPPQGMIPARSRRRTKLERGSMRVLATGGIIGLATVLGAVLVNQSVAGWIVGLAVGLTSVILAALLWSSRQL